MALDLYANIRLDVDLTGDLPTNTYEVKLDEFEDTFTPVVATERSLTNRLQVHRLMDGSDPIVNEGHRYTLILSRAEKDQVKDDMGKVVYFMPHYRDESDVATYRKPMLLMPVSGTAIFDPEMNWWHWAIALEDASGIDVG
jgi:hypothetical protein